ncbi:hypothetical protein [Streptomyces sp. NPDC002845]
MELVWNGLLLAAAMSGDETARSRWAALETLVRRPLPQGATCATGIPELEALAAVPTDAARAGALAVALAERARAEPDFADELSALWGAGEGAHFNLATGDVHGTLIQARNILGPVSVNVTKADPEYLRDPRQWPVAREWDPLQAGVKRARPGDDGSALPPYVERDLDTELRDRLAAAGRDGGLVLVTGDSTAGKSRAAFEALRAVLPDHRVVQPAAGGDLDATARAVARAGIPCVVWLDDLERYLGPDGLTPGLLDRLARTATPVLATMRLRQYETFARGTTGDDDARLETAALGMRILNAAERVDISRVWSDQELARAEDHDDSRLVDAVAHHGPYGVAEYLAAGPALLDAWQRAWLPGGNPRGAALVAAAVDLARTGLPAPYPRELLAELHEGCLTEAGGRRLRPEGLDEAFAWATELRYGVTSLLLPAEEGDGWAVFDYLVDHTDGPVPMEVWDTALMRVTEPAERFAVGYAAWSADLPHVVEAAWRPMADLIPEVARWLGAVLDHEGQEDRAEEMFRSALHGSALHAGSVAAATDLGLLLARSGREGEAEAWLRLAVAHGDDRAMFLLAELLRQTDRPEAAEEHYRRAAAEGNVPARAGLGMLLADTGREDEAEEHLRRAADAGNTGAAAALGLLMARAGRVDEAEEFIGSAEHPGSFALWQLARGLTRARGDAESAVEEHEEYEEHSAEAEWFYSRTAVTSRIEAADGPGGGVLRVPDPVAEGDEAEIVRRRAARGHIDSTLYLAGLLYRERRGFDDDLYQRIRDARASGDHERAAALARPAADKGDAAARSMLITALMKLGREEEALPHARAAVAAGDESELPELAMLLSLTGREEEAERHVRLLDGEVAYLAHAIGHYFSVLQEVVRRRDRGELLEAPDLPALNSRECRERAEGYFRFAARLGHTEAAAELAELLHRSGRSGQAATYYRQAADGGHLEAAFQTAVRLEAEGETATAERYYRRAADRGHRSATRRLRKLLAKTGRRGEAREDRRRAVAARSRRGRLEAGPAQKTAWAVLVLVSLGLLSWVPFLYVAIRRGARGDWWAFGGYLLAAITLVPSLAVAAGNPGHPLPAFLMSFLTGMNVTSACRHLMGNVFDEPDSP